jgi:hypothetical protein
LRAVLLPLLDEDDDRLVPALRPLEAVERRPDEVDDDEPLEELRLRPPDEPLEELRLRPPDDPLEELLAGLREPDEPEDLRELDPPELRALDPRELAARDADAREPDEEPLDLRALDARALDPDDLRPPDPPLDLLRDEPPPLPEPDSAIALLL